MKAARAAGTRTATRTVWMPGHACADVHGARSHAVAWYCLAHRRRLAVVWSLL